MGSKRKIQAFLSNDKNEEANETWNREFWQNAGDEQIFAAAWELVKTAWETNGKDQRELRFARTIGVFKPARR